MSEQIIIDIVRPEVSIGYHPESQEAGQTDRLAACELSLYGLARDIQRLRSELGLPCPTVITCFLESGIWQNGM